jgi:hypothetical protein
MASTLTVDNIVGATTASTVHAPGHVIQVQSVASSAQLTLSSTNTWVATGIQLNITPKFSNSKIYIVANIDFDANAANRILFTSIFRNDSVNLGQATNGFNASMSSGGRMMSSVGINHLDSPATTSAVNYEVYARCNNQPTYINLYGGVCGLTLMEIAQ